MNYLDFSIIGFVGLSTLIGLWRGFIIELVLLMPWLVAILLAVCFSPSVDHVLTFIQTPLLKTALGFFLVFLPTYLVLWMGARLLKVALKDLLSFSGSNRLLGFIFGLARGVLVAILILMVLQHCDVENTAWWKSSLVAPYVSKEASAYQALWPWAAPKEIVESPS